MATLKNTVTKEFEGYDSAHQAAAAESARLSSLIYAIGHMGELLEDCHSHGDVYPLATSIQALVESAHIHGEIVVRALDSMKKEASRG